MNPEIERQRFENVIFDQQAIINAYHEGYLWIMNLVKIAVPLEFDRDVPSIEATTRDILSAIARISSR